MRYSPSSRLSQRPVPLSRADTVDLESLPFRSGINWRARLWYKCSVVQDGPPELTQGYCSKVQRVSETIRPAGFVA